jgi:hypothetical protein
LGRNPRRKAVRKFAEVFERVLSQVIMSKAGSKGIPGTNRIGNLHAKAAMLNRLRL